MEGEPKGLVADGFAISTPLNQMPGATPYRFVIPLNANGRHRQSDACRGVNQQQDDTPGLAGIIHRVLEALDRLGDRSGKLLQGLH